MRQPIIRSTRFFRETPAGAWRKNLPNTEGEFTSFVPTPLAELELGYDDGLVAAIVEARLALARLASGLAETDDETRMALIRREARASASLAYPRTVWDADVAEAQARAEADPEDEEAEEHARQVGRRDVDAEQLAKAIDYLSWRVDELPLSGRLLQEAHGMALEAQFHDGMTPGWFRTSPAWMGAPGRGLAEASFVPPVPEDLAPAIADLERALNEETGMDPALLAALTHYQFEATHPFLDGNGRIGRALTTQLLVERGVLPKPVLLLSEELLGCAADYYEQILSLEFTGDYRRWAVFFLGVLARAAGRTEAALATAGQSAGGRAQGA